MSDEREKWKQSNSIRFAGTALSACRIYQLLGDAMAMAPSTTVSAIGKLDFRRAIS